MARPKVGPCSVCGSWGYARGLCRRHYEKMKRGDPVVYPPVLCKEPDCDGRHYARGWCARHYNRYMKRLRPRRYVPRPPRPEFYNPLVPQIEGMALRYPPRFIAGILGITRNTVIGIIWRGRQAGRLHNPKDPVYIPTPDRFPPRSGCLYMVGDPKDPSSTFCGKPVFVFGEAWCAEHRKIVYKPALDLSTPSPEQTRFPVIEEAAD